MKLKPYPKYKDSGIKWIGKIPEGWEIERYKIGFPTIWKKGEKPEKFPEEFPEKFPEKTSEKILHLITENKKITIAEISRLIGISDRAVKKHISKLKEKGILKRVGPDKGGYWEVIK